MLVFPAVLECIALFRAAGPMTIADLNAAVAPAVNGLGRALNFEVPPEMLEEIVAAVVEAVNTFRKQ